MRRMPQPIPYQGSKREIALEILKLAPDHVKLLIEPFTGSGALSVRAAYEHKADRFWLNDINRPLMTLIETIVNEPAQIANRYEELWQRQLGQERSFYNAARNEFNATHRSDLFLYLLARCVKASIRYNSDGHFNQSPDNRRKGRHPDSMRKEILAFSQLLRGKMQVTSQDYRSILGAFDANSTLIYLDPPYQGTSGSRDSRYYSGVDFNEFVAFMVDLNRANAMFIVSYDGRRGKTTYGQRLPTSLKLCHAEIDAGRSTQSTLLGRRDKTYESLYLSESLMARLALTEPDVETLLDPHRSQQLTLVL
ncbi:MAG: DNA adenine methylase [Ardenticatenales bacterium]|nr:DNA adenine methylase [Ardenticatenales bacterium]